MASAVVGAIRADLVANTARFSKGIGRAKKDLGGLNVAGKQSSVLMNRMKTAMVGFLGVAAGFAALRAATRTIEGFNQALKSSTAIMGTLSGAMQADMVKAAQKVAFQTKFSGKEAAAAYYYLASAGLDAKQSIASLPAVAKFAQAGMFDLSRATDLLTDAQSALGMTVKDAGKNMANMQRVSDVLVRANTLANASVEQFSEALTTKAAAALRIVGKDVEEGVAVLAAFADQGLKGSDAGTAFSIVMRDLQTKALKNAAAFKEANVVVYDSAGKMRNLADIVGDLERALDGQSDAQKKATLLALGFSDKSVAYTQAVLGMSGKIREYEAALRKAAGTTEDVADNQLTEFGTATNRLSAALERLVVNIGGPVLEAIGRLINMFVDMNPLVRKVVAGILGFATGWLIAVKIIPAVIRLGRSLIAMYKALATAQAISLALSGKRGWIALMTGLAFAAGGVYLVSQAFDGLDADMKKTVAEAEKVGEQAEKVQAKLDKLADGTAKAFDGTAKSIEKVGAALEELPMPAGPIKSMAELREKQYAALERQFLADADKGIVALGEGLDAMLKSKFGDLAHEMGWQFDRADRKAALPNQESQPLAALERGTQAAQAAEARHQQLQQQQLAEMKEQTRELHAIRSALVEATFDQPDDIVLQL